MHVHDPSADSLPHATPVAISIVEWATKSPSCIRFDPMIERLGCIDIHHRGAPTRPVMPLLVHEIQDRGPLAARTWDWSWSKSHVLDPCHAGAIGFP